MKIIKLLPFFAPAYRFGGPVVQAESVSRGLVERGHEVHVLSTDNGIPEDLPRDTWLSRDGYRVRYSRTIRNSERRPPYAAPTDLCALLDVLPGSDVLCMNVGFTMLNHHAARVARAAGVGYVYNAEGCLCPTRMRQRRLLKWLFLRMVERPIIRGAAALQAVTEKERADLLRQGADPRRIHVVANGVHTPDQTSDGSAFRRLHQLGDTKLVLFLGRIERIKGIDLLLQAWASAQPDALLLLAGPDEGARAALQDQVRQLGLQEQVRFLGELDAAGRDSAFAAADLFVLTSRSEGLPNAVLEACAAGLPQLLTEPCNVPEVATFGAGHVVPLQVKRIAASLSAMLSSPARLQQMRVGARRLAEERFALPKVLDQLEAMYQRVAQR